MQDVKRFILDLVGSPEFRFKLGPDHDVYRALLVRVAMMSDANFKVPPNYRIAMRLNASHNLISDKINKLQRLGFWPFQKASSKPENIGYHEEQARVKAARLAKRELWGALIQEEDIQRYL